MNHKLFGQKIKSRKISKKQARHKPSIKKITYLIKLTIFL